MTEEFHGRFLLIVHQLTSDPGRVGLALRTRGYKLDICRPACGDRLPESLDEYTGAVMFGGPMSANDTHEPYIREETEWIGTALDSGKPFLGICLGAQIMARHLGAGVKLHPEGLVEIGYVPLYPTEAGADLFPSDLHVFQWHREGFDLPHGAELLATSDVFANQAFRLGRHAYGIQFHPEVSEAMNRRWATRAAHRLELPGAHSPERQLRDRERYDRRVLSWMDGFLDRWLSEAEDRTEAHPGPAAGSPAEVRQSL